MNTVIRYSGWVVAVLLLICLGVLLGRPLKTEEATVAEAEPAPAAAVADEAALLAELESVKAEKAVLEAELAALKIEADAAQSPPDTPPPAPETAAEPTPPTAPENEAGESSGERIAKAQFSIMADMMYKQLFDELDLTPEARAALKDSIAAHMLAMQRETLTAMGSKKETAKSFHARMETMKAALRDELGATLGPEELAAWDEYEPVADQILYERMVEGQLNMMAPGLAGDNRLLASQVMAEELVREFDAFNESDEMYTQTNFNNAQTRALNASLERLAAELEEEQYNQVRGFVEQAIGMFEAMAEQ